MYIPGGAMLAVGGLRSVKVPAPVSSLVICKPTRRWCMLNECEQLHGATSTARVMRLLASAACCSDGMLAEAYDTWNVMSYPITLLSTAVMAGFCDSMKKYGGEKISTRYSALLVLEGEYVQPGCTENL